MKRYFVTFILFICICCNSSTYAKKPTWRFSVIAAISESTATYYGGPEAAKNLVLQQFLVINNKFNNPGVFSGYYEFVVDSVYVFTGNPISEVFVPHPDFDYRIVYDAFPTQGGGWQGSYSAIYHAWSWDYFGGIFGSTATDGVIHEFGHSRGAIDLYALQVNASNNPVNNMAYAAERSIMNYPYGETKWDEHTINILNRNADSIPKTSSYITTAFPDIIMLKIYDTEGFPACNAEITLFPVSWFSNTVNSTPSHTGLSDSLGAYVFPDNPYGPATLKYPWHIKYPNFLLRVKAGEKEYYRFLPLTEVQNFYFRYGNTPFIITLGSAYKPLDQTIAFHTLEPCVYGDSDFMLTATSSSGLLVSFTSSDSNIVSIDSNRMHIKNAGMVNVTANQAGNKYYNPALPVVQKLVVNKAQLNILVSDTIRVYGDPNPCFKIIYGEFVGNDNIDSLNVIPTVYCDADEFTDAGQVNIALKGGSDNNYELYCTNGTLWILKADQEIFFDSICPQTIGNIPFELTGYATSGLEIEYSSSNPEVAIINGDTVTIAHTGTTVISANQYGNNNYNAANQVQRILLVQESTGLDRNEQLELLVYPNPVSKLLHIISKSGNIKYLKLYNTFGSLVIQLHYNSNSCEIDLASFANGIYLLEIFNENRSRKYKVLVNRLR